jgi:hypothetical protein
MHVSRFFVSRVFLSDIHPFVSTLAPAKVLAITKPALQGDFITARKAHLENVCFEQLFQLLSTLVR